MSKESIELKIEKIEESIEKLNIQKDKYLKKAAAIDEKMEQYQAKLKDIKSGTLIDTCEKQDLSIRDIQVLSKGIADGSVLEYLGIKKIVKEKENEKQD